MENKPEASPQLEEILNEYQDGIDRGKFWGSTESFRIFILKIFHSGERAAIERVKDFTGKLRGDLLGRADYEELDDLITERLADILSSK